jgi:hypothetical protein
MAKPKAKNPKTKRNKPVLQATISHEALDKLDEIARRLGLTRSAANEKIIREAEMPKELSC